MVMIVLFVLPMVFLVSLSSNPVCGSGMKLEEQPLKWERLGIGSSIAVRKRLLSVLVYVVGLFHVVVAQRDESYAMYGVGAWVTSAKGDQSGFVIVLWHRSRSAGTSFDSFSPQLGAAKKTPRDF